MAKIGAARDAGSDVQWQVPPLIERLESRADLERLLTGLLDQLGRDTGDHVGIPASQRELGYFSAIAAAAVAILERCADHEAPSTVIDAALRLGARRHGYLMSAEKAQKRVVAELRRTSTRRRLAYWQAASQLSERAKQFLAKVLHH